MRTFSVRLRDLGRSSIGSSARSLTSEAGDTLIEVIISALLVGLIVVGTFTGLNSANRATSIDRARSQADALAEQAQEQMRSYPISEVDELTTHPKTKTVTEGKTVFTIETSAAYEIEEKANASCSSSSSANAEYLKTTSKVTSPAISGKAVEETGLISPPAGAALAVQVTNSGTYVPGAKVVAEGPSSAAKHELETSTNGCAILAVLPGEYNLNVSKPGYVDQNWYQNSDEDKSASVTHTVYIPAETTSKEGYNFAPAARLNPLSFEELNPSSGVHEIAKALNAVLVNTGMEPSFKLLEPEGSSLYVSSIATTKRIFPFPSENPYTVFAGSCLANEPPAGKRTTAVFPAEGEISKAVVLPSLIIKVWKGTKAKPETLVTTAPEIFLSDADIGCENTYHQPATVAPVEKSKVLEYPKGGALEYPGQPWGTYIACVNVTYSGKPWHYSSLETKNNNPEQKGTPIELYEGGPEGKELEEKSCP